MEFPAFVYWARVGKCLRTHPCYMIPVSTAYQVPWKLLWLLWDQGRSILHWLYVHAGLDLHWLQISFFFCFFSCNNAQIVNIFKLFLKMIGYLLGWNSLGWIDTPASFWFHFQRETKFENWKLFLCCLSQPLFCVCKAQICSHWLEILSFKSSPLLQRWEVPVSGTRIGLSPFVVYHCL